MKLIKSIKPKKVYKDPQHLVIDNFFDKETKSKISKSFVVRLPKKDSEIEIKEIPLNKKLFSAFIGAKYLMEQMQSIEY